MESHRTPVVQPDQSELGRQATTESGHHAQLYCGTTTRSGLRCRPLCWMGPMRKGKRFPMLRCSNSLSNITASVANGTTRSDLIFRSLAQPAHPRDMVMLFLKKS